MIRSVAQGTVARDYPGAARSSYEADRLALATDPIGSIVHRYSDALIPEARSRAARLCLEGSKSRNRLSEVHAWPVFVLPDKSPYDFTPADDAPGRRTAASKARRGAAWSTRHRADHGRHLRRPAAARQGLAGRRGLDPLALRRRTRARSAHHARDRRRGLDQHDVLRPPSWPA